MSSPTILTAAVAIFVIAALLYYQSVMTKVEHFVTYDDNTIGDKVPADLNRANIAIPNTLLPTSGQRPQGIPGAMSAPSEALATRKDLGELDDKIMTWLDAASQRERANPISLTPEQLQQRAILQARLSDVRRQLGTGLITDKAAAINQEIMRLRSENEGWQKAAPTLAQVNDFAKNVPGDAFLTAEQYTVFRGMFMAGIHEYEGHTQPDPLQKIRLQQLQVLQQDLVATERKFNPPPIRASAARLFLQQMMKPDQPLPTLFSMEPNPATVPRSTKPLDVIQQLKDIQWKLTITYNPAEQELLRTISDMVDRMESGEASSSEVANARQQLVEYQHERAPQPIGSANPSHVASLDYDPSALVERANTLCDQIREAFPGDALALGCPKKKITDTFQAETAINTVCNRLRYSVPTVSPAQFNCPRHVV